MPDPRAPEAPACPFCERSLIATCEGPVCPAGCDLADEQRLPWEAAWEVTDSLVDADAVAIDCDAELASMLDAHAADDVAAMLATDAAWLAPRVPADMRLTWAPPCRAVGT